MAGVTYGSAEILYYLRVCLRARLFVHVVTQRWLPTTLNIILRLRRS